MNFRPLPDRYRGFNKMLLTSDTWGHALHLAQVKREWLGEKAGLAREETLGRFSRSCLHSFAASFIPRARSKIPDKPAWDDMLTEKPIPDWLLISSYLGFLQQVAGWKHITDGGGKR